MALAEVLVVVSVALLLVLVVLSVVSCVGTVGRVSTSLSRFIQPIAHSKIGNVGNKMMKGLNKLDDVLSYTEIVENNGAYEFSIIYYNATILRCISRIERGTCSPTIRTLSELAYAMGKKLEIKIK